MSFLKRKILVVSWVYPWPESLGASMRTLNFVRFFKKYGDVDIVYSLGSPGSSSENPLFSTKYHLEKKPYPEDLMGRFFMAVKGAPYPIQEYGRDSLRRLFDLIETNDYRCIFARYCHSTSGLFKLPVKFRSRTIVDIDDILSGSVYDSYFDEKGGVHRKIIRTLNKKLLSLYERRCLNFGAALFCSESDRAKFEKTSRKNIFVVPNTYENRSFQTYEFGDGHKNANTLLFVGTLRYPPNIEGLRWFIQTIFRRFKAEVPDARLVVVGHAPAAEVKAFCGREEGIELHADAADVRGFYERCRAVVVPLLSGGGTRIKILEAALAKRPVLATPVGAEGLGLINGKDLLLFETPEDFCLNYKKLHNDRFYDSMVTRSKRVVQEMYSMEKFEKSMQQVLWYLEGPFSRGASA